MAEIERPAVKIYTDGGCDPNPGPGGYGVVLIHPKKRKELSGGFRKTTNNRMEIYAAIAGLEFLKMPCKVTIYSDSQYLVKAIQQHWVLAWKRRGWWKSNQEPALNVDLWERLLVLCAKHQVIFQWVRGHSGNKENERCDVLSTQALRKPGLPPDTGYEDKKARPVRVTIAEGEPCWTCGTRVAKQASDDRPAHGYYYEWYLQCPKCKTKYRLEEAKRFAEGPRKNTEATKGELFTEGSEGILGFEDLRDMLRDIE